MDVFEVDAASNRGIDEIRELRETVKFAPVDGRFKVYIIDEVHMLTTEAFNALLKTLEEPPAHVVFILATTEPHKIPATIHSRCQRYDFRRIGGQEIEKRLRDVCSWEKINFEPEALALIASQADGGMRDALSILDQCATLGTDPVCAADVRKLLGLIGHEWIWTIMADVARRDVSSLLRALDEIVMQGKDVRQILQELALHGRSLLLYKAAPDIDTIEMYSADKKILAEQSSLFSYEELTSILQIINEAINEVKWADEPRIVVEMVLIKACRRSFAQDVASLAQRVAELEKRLREMPILPVGESPTPAPRYEIHNHKEQLKAFQHQQQEHVKEKPETQLVTQPETSVSEQFEEADSVYDLKEVWENVLKEILNCGKRAAYACVQQGKLISINNGQAVLQFNVQFPKERTEKEDYRTIIENIFRKVCGRPLRLSCILGNDSNLKASQMESNSQHKGTDHPVLQQAVKMFGGKVIKQENNEEV
jgi:DNA polymerase-3 subunit gamma/tau